MPSREPLTLSEAEGPKLPMPLPLIHDMLRETVRKYPDNVAIVSRYQARYLYETERNQVNGSSSSTDCLRWTYSHLLNMSTRLAIGLTKRGISKGMPIATFLPNRVEYMTVLWTAIFLGCPIVPLSGRSLANREEICHMLRIGKPKVVIIDDEVKAKTFMSLKHDAECDDVLQVLVNGEAEGSLTDWVSLSSLLTSTSTSTSTANSESDSQMQFSQHDIDDPCAILFTSGSTSRPKGCPHTYGSLSTQVLGVASRLYLDLESRYAAVMPNNHAIGLLHPLMYLTIGGTVCYPNDIFDARSLAAALEEEKCTNLVCVPTMLHALLEYSRTRGMKYRGMRQVDIGGAAVSPVHLHQTIYDLGVQKVGTSMGQTEGACLRAFGASDPEDLVVGDEVFSGTVTPGVAVRVCAPDSWHALPIGQAGELIHSGGHLIKGYIGKPHGDDFKYVDGRLWLRTGDQVVMHPNGGFTVVGRYKDMIIRGGENIAPATIERTLNTVDGVNAVVVGARDPIAGEVPIAVYTSTMTSTTNGDPSISITHLRNLILSKMGPSFIPDDFLSLSTLNVTALPTLISGKVDKITLAKLVREYRSKTSDADTHISPAKSGTPNGEHQTSSNGASSNSDHMRSTVLAIWSSILGLRSESIDTTVPVSDFADSINIMRYRDRVQKRIGVTISLEDVMAWPSIEDQIQLLCKDDIYLKGKKARSKTSSATTTKDSRTGPPEASDMIHTCGDEAMAHKTKMVVSQTLKPLGLDWEEVEDVIPATDLADVMYKQHRDVGWSFRHVYMTQRTSSADAIAALKKVLEKHAILRSVFVRVPDGTSDVALHVTLRPSESWFNICLLQKGEVQDEEELKSYALDDPQLGTAKFSGPALKVIVLDVRNVQSAGLIFVWLRLMFEDLDSALAWSTSDESSSKDPGMRDSQTRDSAPLQIDDHIPYKVWADTYFSLRTSLPARLSVDWHVKRLAQLNVHRGGLFPRQRAPQWFLGSRRGWEPSREEKDGEWENLYGRRLDGDEDEKEKREGKGILNGDKVSNGDDKLLNGNRVQTDSPARSLNGTTGITHHISLPGVKSLLKTLPGVTYPTVFKTVIALFNVQVTGHSHAIFHQNEASRTSLPFMPDHLTAYMEDVNCADVAGPCWNKVVNLIEVRRGQKLGDILRRVQDEQRLLSKYAQAPLLDIAQRLEMDDEGAGSSDMYLDALRRQVFNWVPGAGAGSVNPYKHMLSVQSIPRGDIGLVWWAGMGGDDGVTLTLRVMWDEANMMAIEAKAWIEHVVRIAEWACSDECDSHGRFGADREVGGSWLPE